MAGGGGDVAHARIARSLPVKVMGFVAAAENMPDGKAQKPGDVQTAYPASRLKSSIPTKTLSAG